MSLKAKEDSGQRLSPHDVATLDNLKDFVKVGRPIDDTHPDFDNLSPNQQQ